MPFAQFPGNEKVKEILRLALRRKKLPRSLILVDSSGGGADRLAQILAQAVNCLQQQDDACGLCANCQAIEAGRFPDVLVVEPEKEIIRVEKIREVKRLAYLKPMIGRYRVFIIRQSEKMNEQAANTFLKVLEEPPASTLFILLTANPHLLLPTIRSRCQELHLAPLPREMLEKYLTQAGKDKNEARLLAYLVKGDIEEILKFDLQELRPKRENLWELVKSCLQEGSFSVRIKEYTSLGKHHRLLWLEALEIMASFWRDILLMKLRAPEELMINYDFREEIKRISSVVSIEIAEKSLKWLDQAAEDIKKNLNIQVIINSYLSRYQGQDNA